MTTISARRAHGWEKLVPKYLQGVPSDPFSGRPMLYRKRFSTTLKVKIHDHQLL